jgi:plasmid stabilization system protein ParE
MYRRIIPSPDARADVESAARWYRRKEANLSRQFRAEVRTTLLRIAQFPYASSQVDDPVRRVLTNRFPYRIDFIFDANSILVLGITHQRRSDAVWKDRMRELPGEDTDD